MTLPLPSVSKFEWVRALSRQPTTAVTRTEHHIGLALAGYLTTAGHGWVSHAQLAGDCRVSTRTVCSALTSLVSKGWLLRRSGKRGTATTYWTRIPDGAVTAPQRKARSAHQVADYLAVIATTCGLDKLEEADGSDALHRLTGSLAHILRNLDERPEDARKLFERLTEGPLTSAHDPAAVLLHRLGHIVRADPSVLTHAVAPADPSRSELVDRSVEQIAAALSSCPGQGQHQLPKS